MRSLHLRAHLHSAARIAAARGPVAAGRRYVATAANAGIEALCARDRAA